MANQQPNISCLHRRQTREGQEDFWLAIGAAFMHQDGDGYQRRPASAFRSTARSCCGRRRTSRAEQHRRSVPN